MDLFDYMRETTKKKESPLASRLPSEDSGGSGRTAAYNWKDKLLYRAIKADKLSSIFLWTSGNREDNTGKGDCQYD